VLLRHAIHPLHLLGALQAGFGLLGQRQEKAQVTAADRGLLAAGFLRL
jgi:hypothetical protein